MNTRTRIALAGAACVIGSTLAFAAPSVASPENPSAAMDQPAAGPPPSQAYVWMTGHWNSEGGQWMWLSAHWELPPTRSAVWVAGHWVSRGGAWVWVNGAWNIADAQQTQTAPPQPPGRPPQAAGEFYQGASPEGSVAPLPGTPAPYVDGQYAPGGVIRAIDQPPVTTDYGPIGYTAYYSDYGWAGYPWLWGGFPGPFIGLDLGPGYYGWRGYHGGGYGHWGHGGYRGRGASGHAGGHFR
jgi:hypothetical protein